MLPLILLIEGDDPQYFVFVALLKMFHQDKCVLRNQANFDAVREAEKIRKHKYAND